MLSYWSASGLTWESSSGGPRFAPEARAASLLVDGEIILQEFQAGEAVAQRAGRAKLSRHTPRGTEVFSQARLPVVAAVYGEVHLVVEQRAQQVMAEIEVERNARVAPDERGQVLDRQRVAPNSTVALFSSFFIARLTADWGTKSRPAASVRLRVCAETKKARSWWRSSLKGTPLM